MRVCRKTYLALTVWVIAAACISSGLWLVALGPVAGNESNPQVCANGLGKTVSCDATRSLLVSTGLFFALVIVGALLIAGAGRHSANAKKRMVVVE